MTSVERECTAFGVGAPSALALRDSVVLACAGVFALSARTAVQEVLSAIRAEMMEPITVPR